MSVTLHQWMTQTHVSNVLVGGTLSRSPLSPLSQQDKPVRLAGHGHLRDAHLDVCDLTLANSDRYLFIFICFS